MFGKWCVIMYMARIGCYLNPKGLLTTLIYEWLDWYSRDVISSSFGNLYPQSHDNRIALKFDRYPDSAAAEVLVKFNRDYQSKKTHSRSVVEQKRNLQCPKLKIHNRIDGNVSFINISKFITTLRVSIIMLWWYGNCVCIQLFVTGIMQNFLPVTCRITIWAPQQNGRTISLTVPYLVIVYTDENLLQLYKSCLVQV